MIVLEQLSNAFEIAFVENDYECIFYSLFMIKREDSFFEEIS